MYRRGSIKNYTGNIWMEILVRFVLIVIFLFTEEMKPFIRIIQPEEMWLYRNPVANPDTVTTLTLFTIVVVVPLTAIVLFLVIKRDKLDFQQALLAVSLALALNGVVTNVIKLLVGRPRPDFLYRCFPDGRITEDLKCTGNDHDIIEGRKSFPSGHSSWSFAGLGFASMYLAGQLHVFESQGRGKSWRLCMAGAPILASTMIAITRTSDYRHHWQDILVGSILGTFIMILCYRQYFPSLTHPLCDKSYASLISSMEKADFQLKDVMVSDGLRHVSSNPNIKHI